MTAAAVLAVVVALLFAFAAAPAAWLTTDRRVRFVAAGLLVACLADFIPGWVTLFH